MIQLENTVIYGWEPAIRGMRNPLNSWDKSDSFAGEVGPNDLALMKKLIRAGAPDRKFLRMIVVWVDITAPEYWWPEFDTYKVGTVRNSCSKMHRLHSRPLTLDDFSTEHLHEENIALLKQVISVINTHRKLFTQGKNKDDWWQMLQLLPISYNQRATVMLNYEVLRNIWHTRRYHKQDEWREDFCKWIETLPYSELITMEDISDERKAT